MSLPSDILQRSPEEAARRIALGLLSESREVCERLLDLDDLEALHAFRVSVRRLRSTLRVWQRELAPSVGRKDRRLLGRLQDATGEGRDAEVAAAWLVAQRPEFGRGQRRGLDWLIQRLEQRRHQSMEQVRNQVRRQFAKIEADLDARLECMTVEVHLRCPDAGAVFGATLAARAREGSRELAKLLAGIASAEDQKSSHRARIACKRLRYLLEPVRPFVEEAARIVKRCKRLQDVLGELNDAHVLRDEVGSALEDATIEQTRRLLELARGQDAERMRLEARRGERPGLLEVARRVQVRIREAFEDLEKSWLTTGIHTLVEDVEAMARRLESGAPANVEIERKYLLSKLPRLPEGTDFVEVDQGWIPGSQIRERVRRVRRGEELSYHRAFKFGSGLRRIEIEEPTTKPIFDALWRLTAGCRVRKRRWLVREGSLVWEVDQFRDRALVVAEVELPSPAARPPVPKWLADSVVREVTEDARFANLRLAERPGWVPEAEASARQGEAAAAEEPASSDPEAPR